MPAALFFVLLNPTAAMAHAKAGMAIQQAKATKNGIVTLLQTVAHLQHITSSAGQIQLAPVANL